MDKRLRIGLSAAAIAAIVGFVALPPYVLGVLLVIIGVRGGGNWFAVAGVIGCAVPLALAGLTLRWRLGDRPAELALVEASGALAAGSWLMWLVLMLLA